MPISSPHGKLLIVFMFILLGGTITPVGAEEPIQSVNMVIAPAYSGYFKYGEWLPIWITLENNGTDFDGEIQVEVVRDFEQTTFAVPVSLPAGSRKRLPLYVLPNNFSHELKIELVTDLGNLLTQTAIVHPQPNINYVIGMVANQRGALTMVPRIQLPGGRLPVPVDVSLDELSDRPEALRSLNSLILNDVDTSSLTPQQVNALAGWVQQGGRLVIGGGAGAMQTTAGFPKEILPLLPIDLTELESIDSLASYADTTPVRIPGPFIISTGDFKQGQTRVEQDGFPLVQEISMGEGFITFIALDLATSPFNAWTGTTDFWETLLTPGATYPSWIPPDMSEQQMAVGSIGNALSNIPSLDLPSSKGIVILLGIYIFLVGPLNYLVLRWRKKLHWGWITIPVITLTFSAMSFGLGYAKRGTDLIINKISIIQGGSDGAARVTSYIGLFSPANQGYELEIVGDNLLRPISNYYAPWMSSIPPEGRNSDLTFVQGSPSWVRGLNVNQWSMQSFMTETTMDEIGPIIADLYIEDQRLVGSVTNKTGLPLNDAVMILKQNFVKLGDLPISASANIDMKLDHGDMHGAAMSWKIFEDQINPSMGGVPQREQEFKRLVLETVIDQQNYYGRGTTPGESRSATELSTVPKVTLIGWMDTAPPEVRIDGHVPQESATSLYKTQLIYHIPREGEITIPPGLIPGLVAELPFTAGTCGFEGASIWIEKGEAVLEFIIPTEFSDIELDNLQLMIQTDAGWGNPPLLDIFNWEIATWQPLDDAVLGINTISNPADNISADGVVRFQISLENNDLRAGSCYYAGLGLKGSR